MKGEAPRGKGLVRVPKSSQHLSDQLKMSCPKAVKILSFLPGRAIRIAVSASGFADLRRR